MLFSDPKKEIILRVLRGDIKVIEMWKRIITLKPGSWFRRITSGSDELINVSGC